MELEKELGIANLAVELAPEVFAQECEDLPNILQYTNNAAFRAGLETACEELAYRFRLRIKDDALSKETP